MAFAQSLEHDINSLLKAVGTSSCNFIRNGNSHTPDEGQSHIQRKYDHYRKKINSIDEFIAVTATRSMISGKEYEVHCPEGEFTSSDWLKAKADELGLTT